MRIPRFLFDRLQHMVDTVPARRPPDVVIGDPATGGTTIGRGCD